jgi:hypothetical protein
MTRSFILAGLLVASLAACARTATPPAAADATVNASGPSSFVPYCGPIWSVPQQGYLYIPCPPDSNYEGAGAATALR